MFVVPCYSLNTYCMYKFFISNSNKLNRFFSIFCEIIYRHSATTKNSFNIACKILYCLTRILAQMPASYSVEFAILFISSKILFKIFSSRIYWIHNSCILIYYNHMHHDNKYYAIYTNTINSNEVMQSSLWAAPTPKLCMEISDPRLTC